MPVTYKTLFSVELLHNYFTNGKCRDVTITPTPDTIAMFSACKIVSKVIGNTLLALIQVDQDGKPLVAPLPQSYMRFYLEPVRADFYNYSLLTHAPSLQQKYHFSNLTDNEQEAGKKMLTAPVARYKATESYLPGALASNASHEVFEAIRSSNEEDKKPLTDADSWHKAGKVQAASAADIITVTGSVYRFFTASPALVFSVKIYGIHLEENSYTQLVSHPEDIALEQAATFTDVNLQALPPGKYSIEVNGEKKDVYYDAAFRNKGALAVIELYNHLPGSHAFALLGAGGKPKETRFSIRFFPRQTYWCYRTRSEDVTAIKDKSPTGPLVFNHPEPLRFISDKPIPFSETPLKSLVVVSSRSGELPFVPAPSPALLREIVQNGETYLCAEKFLNF